MLDLLTTHERFGSSSDPSINGHLHYLNDADRSLNEVPSDKIRKYHSDYHNNPTNCIIIYDSVYPSLLLFLVRLRDYIVNLFDFYSYKIIEKLTTFFSTSGVHLVEPTSGQFHFRHGVLRPD